MSGMFYNSRFYSQIETWTPLRSLYHSVFSDSEVDALSNSANSYQDIQRHIVILAFENRYAALGGLSSVTKYLPKYLAESGEKVVFITPFHKNNTAIKEACSSGELKRAFTSLDCGFGSFTGSVTCYREPNEKILTYYIDIDGFFDADQDPYCYEDKDRLLDDALAFCCVVPFVLRKLGIKKNVLFHANDWETAPIALSSKIATLSSVLESAKTVLTLHNSYDAEIPEGKLEYFFGRKSFGKTILQISLPLLDAPLTTVSEPFAYELMHDPLQREFFAHHLQISFSKNPPVGISNGLFDSANKVFNKKIVTEAKKGRISILLKKKKDLRQRLIKILDRVDDQRVIGRLTFKDSKADVPIFLISGRLDMMQKGYDVIFHSFQKLKQGSAKLIFSPSSLPVDNSEVYRFFVDCANEFDGDIMIWPFIIPEDMFRQFLSGSSFLIMPSFYEPFGYATEGFINGTPVIARSTGGLWAQVESIYPCHIPPYFRTFFNKDEAVSLYPSGILFREDFDGENIEKEWRVIFSGSPKQRLHSKLYCSMIEAAYEAMQSAIDLFHDKEKYGEIIINGLNTLSRLSWEEAVQRYRKVYNCVSRRAL